MDKKEYLTMNQKDRQEIMNKIKEVLYTDERIVFAYVFGSFLNSPSYKDIDAGIYLDNIARKDVFDGELEISKKISEACELPIDLIDIKILNFAPGHFLNNVFKNGAVLFSKNEKMLSKIIEETSLNAVANEYFAYQSLKELVPK